MPDAAPPSVTSAASLPARFRVANSWWFNALLGSITLLALWTGITALPRTIGPLVIAAFVAALWLFLLFLRVTVTRSHVQVRFGFIGPKLPIGSVRDVQVEHYDWTRYGGWGIRRDDDGSYAYSVPGCGGRGVRITYAMKDGLERTVFVSSDRPEELVAAIDAARIPPVRVETYREAAGPRVVEEELGDAPSERHAEERRRSARER